MVIYMKLEFLNYSMKDAEYNSNHKTVQVWQCSFNHSK